MGLGTGCLARRGVGHAPRWRNPRNSHAVVYNNRWAVFGSSRPGRDGTLHFYRWAAWNPRGTCHRNSRLVLSCADCHSRVYSISCYRISIFPARSRHLLVHPVGGNYRGGAYDNRWHHGTGQRSVLDNSQRSRRRRIRGHRCRSDHLAAPIAETGSANNACPLRSLSAMLWAWCGTPWSSMPPSLRPSPPAGAGAGCWVAGSR